MLFVTYTDGRLDGYCAAAAGMAFCHKKKVLTDVLITSKDKIARDFGRLLRARALATGGAAPAPEDHDAAAFLPLLPALVPAKSLKLDCAIGKPPAMIVCGISPSAFPQELQRQLDALAQAGLNVFWLLPWNDATQQATILKGHCDYKAVAANGQSRSLFQEMVETLGLDGLDRVKFLRDVMQNGPETETAYKTHERKVAAAMAAAAAAAKAAKTRSRRAHPAEGVPAIPKPPKLTTPQRYYLIAKMAQKRYFIYGDHDASPEAVRKLAGLKDLTPQDEKLDPRFLFKLRILNGKAAAVKRLRDQLGKLAPTEARVMILGETGSGKDIAAEALHYGSRRAAAPFTAINCAEFLNEGLLSSQIFGYAEGSFTGAQEDTMGIVEKADGGTLFLDEIGEMPAPCQSLLLRFLQDGSFHRMNETEITRYADVRVLCATNRDLAREVREGRFRADLYFRLKEAVVVVPPLRTRKDDIADLANQRLEKLWLNNDWPGEPPKLTPEQAAPLKEYDWPGNIRELHGVVASALYLSIPVPDGIERDPAVRERFMGVLVDNLKKSLANERKFALKPGIGSESAPLAHGAPSAATKGVAGHEDSFCAACQGNPEILDDPTAELAPAAALGDSISIYADGPEKRLKTFKEICTEFISMALRVCGDNKTRTHEAIGIQPNTIRKYLNADKAPANAPRDKSH